MAFFALLNPTVRLLLALGGFFLLALLLLALHVAEGRAPGAVDLYLSASLAGCLVSSLAAEFLLVAAIACLAINRLRHGTSAHPPPSCEKAQQGNKGGEDMREFRSESPLPGLLPLKRRSVQVRGVCARLGKYLNQK